MTTYYFIMLELKLYNNNFLNLVFLKSTLIDLLLVSLLKRETSF